MGFPSRFERICFASSRNSATASTGMLSPCIVFFFVVLLPLLSFTVAHAYGRCARHGASHDSCDGDDGPFAQLMSACKILEGTQASLIQDGWTVQLFACCASSLEQFDSDLHQLSLPEDSAIAKAALRLLWRQCQASLPSASLTPQAAEQPTATQDTSWLDPFPPKVSAEVLGTLKKDFLSN